MRKTTTDTDGTVRCSKCNATNLTPKGKHYACAGCGTKLEPKKAGLRGMTMRDVFNRD